MIRTHWTCPHCKARHKTAGALDLEVTCDECNMVWGVSQVMPITIGDDATYFEPVAGATMPEADVAHEFDPELSPLDALEVISEFGDARQKQLDASKRLLRMYALSALLDGKDVEEIMDACGFQPEKPADPDISTPFGVMSSSAFREMTGMGAARPNRRHEFASWLWTFIHDEVCG